MKFSADVAAAVVASSTRFGLEPAFLAAIVAQESGGDTHAVRYESTYPYLWDVETGAPYKGGLDPAKFPAPDYVTGPTEWIGQKTSWGCAQVMGAVARQHGFQGKFFPELCDPVVGVEFGARVLASIVKKYNAHTLDLALVASTYNAGHPSSMNFEHYVKPVMAFYVGFQNSGL